MWLFPLCLHDPFTSDHTDAPLPAHPALLQALAAAEAVSGESSVRVALVLILTAHVYSRTGRVTLAEGLYREAAKMLHLSAGAAPGGQRRRCWEHA